MREKTGLDEAVLTLSLRHISMMQELLLFLLFQVLLWQNAWKKLVQMQLLQREWKPVGILAVSYTHLDFKVAADLATTYVGSDLLNAGPGDLNILFDIDIRIKL